jgi:hypothetical protein
MNGILAAAGSLALKIRRKKQTFKRTRRNIFSFHNNRERERETERERIIIYRCSFKQLIISHTYFGNYGN